MGIRRARETAHADADLRRLARPATRTLAALGIPVALCTMDGRVVHASDQVSGFLGRLDDDVRGGLLDDLLPPDSAMTLRNGLKAMVESGRPQQVAFDFEHASGLRRPWSCELVPVEDDRDEVRGGLLVTSVDVDAEAELARVQTQFAEYLHLLDTASEAMWRIDRTPHFHYAWCNRAAEQVLDTTLDELRDDPELAVRRTHPDDRATLLEGRLDPAGTEWPMVLRWATRSGDYVRLEVRESSITDDSGALLATFGVARDLSAIEREARTLRDALQREQQAVDELRSIDELRQTFLRAVSHELRTPLTAVVGYAETIQVHAGRLPTDQVESLSERMLRNALRLRSLLDDLLDIDRMSRGTLALQARPTDLADVVLKAVEHIPARPGQIRADLQPAMGRVDGPKVERVVDNLVVNAIKHGGDDVTVWVRTGTSKGHVDLVVEDDGPGIRKEDRERLFRPFEQGEASATESSPGTGLGLTLVRELVQLHEGQVLLDERPGGGVRFTVRLPAAGST